MNPGYQIGNLTLSTETVNGYNKQAFVEWLQTTKHQQLDVAKANAAYVGTWLKSGICKCGADRDQIDWLAGHSLPGVRAHYLADELKQEYAKFESAFRLETD